MATKTYLSLMEAANVMFYPIELYKYAKAMKLTPTEIEFIMRTISSPNTGEWHTVNLVEMESRSMVNRNALMDARNRLIQKGYAEKRGAHQVNLSKLFSTLLAFIRSDGLNTEDAPMCVKIDHLTLENMLVDGYKPDAVKEKMDQIDPIPTCKMDQIDPISGKMDQFHAFLTDGGGSDETPVTVPDPKMDQFRTKKGEGFTISTHARPGKAIPPCNPPLTSFSSSLSLKESLKEKDKDSLRAKPTKPVGFAKDKTGFLDGIPVVDENDLGNESESTCEVGSGKKTRARKSIPVNGNGKGKGYKITTASPQAQLWDQYRAKQVPEYAAKDFVFLFRETYQKKYDIPYMPSETEHLKMKDLYTWYEDRKQDLAIVIKRFITEFETLGLPEDRDFPNIFTLHSFRTKVFPKILCCRRKATVEEKNIAFLNQQSPFLPDSVMNWDDD